MIICKNFHFFSEVYDGDICEILEPKTELLRLQISWGSASKSKIHVFWTRKFEYHSKLNFQALDWARWLAGKFQNT